MVVLERSSSKLCVFDRRGIVESVNVMRGIFVVACVVGMMI